MVRLIGDCNIPDSEGQYALVALAWLGFDFSKSTGAEDHVEPASPDGSARLMIDKQEVIADIIGESPMPGNHSMFAIQFDTSVEIDQVCKKNLGG